MSDLAASPLSVRNADRLCWRPSLLQSHDYKVTTAAEPRAPVGHSAPLSCVLDKRTAPSVSGLPLACRPHAVLRRVGAVVIDALDGEVGSWARSHVAIERLERVAPFVAHDDTASAVRRERGEGGFIATTLGSDPRAVLRCSGHPVGAIDTKALAKTTATATRAVAQAGYIDLGASTTTTLAHHVSRVSSARGVSLDSPVTERVATLNSRHRGPYYHSDTEHIPGRCLGV